MAEISGRNEQRIRLSRVIKSEGRTLNTHHCVSVKRSNEFDIGSVGLGRGDRWPVCRRFSCVGDASERRISLDLYAARRGASDLLPEVIGADIERIEVLVALQLDGERLFNDGRPDRLFV